MTGTWFKGCKCESHDIQAQPGQSRVLESCHYRGDDRGYEIHVVVMTLKDEGSLILTGSDNSFIYLYPEQVQCLRKLLVG